VPPVIAARLIAGGAWNKPASCRGQFIDPSWPARYPDALASGERRPGDPEYIWIRAWRQRLAAPRLIKAPSSAVPSIQKLSRTDTPCEFAERQLLDPAPPFVHQLGATRSPPGQRPKASAVVVVLDHPVAAVV
jgi:hypothetical protein